MSAGIIIQARSGSLRFPRKVLQPLAGHSVLWHVIKRAIKAEIPNCKIIVATSTLPADDGVNDEALRAGALVYRGAIFNVLKRYYDTATFYELDLIIRVTGDCPFIDPALIHKLYNTMTTGQYEYVCIDAMASYPNGLDGEIFRYRELEEEYRKYKKSIKHPRYMPRAEAIEHVSTHIKDNKQLRRAKIKYVGSKIAPHMRLTIDYKQDLVVLQVLADALFPKNPYFNFDMIIDYMQRHPEICQLNANLEDLKSNGGRHKKSVKNSNNGKNSRHRGKQ